MKIRDVMSTDVHSCTPGTTARDALALMYTHDIGALPVVDDSGGAVGMITDRDLAMACCVRDVAPTAIRVDEITTRNVWSVKPDDAVEEAELVMEERQVRRLPVLDGGRVVGIVSLADLVRGDRSVPAPQVAQTLAAITEPRA